MPKTTHGLRKRGEKRLPEYVSWMHMIQRCTNPKFKGFNRYGGRGISVCEHWRSFANFLEDMGKKPSPQHTLDRINNDGNYELLNCRWATFLEQQRNRSDNRKLTFEGRTLTIGEWADYLKIPRSTLYKRKYFTRRDIMKLTNQQAE